MTTCMNCGWVFTKATAKFCGKCGTKKSAPSRPSAPAPAKTSTPTPAAAAPASKPKNATVPLMPAPAAGSLPPNTPSSLPSPSKPPGPGKVHHLPTAEGSPSSSSIHNNTSTAAPVFTGNKGTAAVAKPALTKPVGLPGPLANTTRPVPSSSSSAAQLSPKEVAATSITLPPSVRNTLPPTASTSSPRPSIIKLTPTAITTPRRASASHLPPLSPTTTPVTTFNHDDLNDDTIYNYQTIEVDAETEEEMVKRFTISTLGPDGITPEMLQTDNAEELRSARKGTLVGRGTYGSVFLALLPDGSFYAMKCVELGRKTGTFTPKELVGLSREITMMRRLSHKNLCTFKGVYYDSEGTAICMFMQYVGGGTLTSLVKKFKPLPFEVIRMWTKQLLQGLLYLHKQRIIHRDVKGDNILIDTSSNPSDEAQIKLVDFGAAKRLTDAVAQSRTVIGTPYWMAPEVVNVSGEDSGYSYKADVWSVGCTVAEMITGSPPWPTKATIPAAIMMIAQADGPPTELPREGVAPGCLDFMLKCFTRNPDQRPAVEELLRHPWIKGK